MKLKTQVTGSSVVREDPKYRRAEEHLRELRARLTALELESTQASNPTAEERAGALVFDGREATAPSLDLPDEKDTVRRRRDHATIRLAVKKQTATLEQLERDISSEICSRPAVREGYRAVIVRLAQALVAAADAAKAERLFRDTLERDGVLTGFLQPQPFGILGDPDQWDSRLNYWLREASAAGFLGSNGRGKP